MKITKIIQWDMGHRIANHRSICKGLHGHRYKAEICIIGKIIDINGISEEGMVIDFADIKKISTEFIQDKLDHAFMVSCLTLTYPCNLHDIFTVLQFL